MSPEQALEILKQLAALANAPLQAHINAQQAVASGKPKWFAKIGAKVLDWFCLKVFNQVDHCANAIDTDEKYQNELWRWHN